MSLPKPEYKPAPVQMMTFVKVPRAVCAQYADGRWTDAVSAAVAGLDGLQLVKENYYITGGVLDPGEWAMLRESPSGGCYLFLQHWCDQTNDARWRTGVRG